MNVSELRQAITALGLLSATLRADNQKYSTYIEGAAAAAVDPVRVFSGYLQFSNTAARMLEDLPAREIRKALSSLAFHGYSYCVEKSKVGSDFSPSRNKMDEVARALGGPISCAEALSLVRDSLGSPNSLIAGPKSMVGQENVADVERSAAATEREDEGADESIQYFAEAAALSSEERLAALLRLWQGRDAEVQSGHTAAFEHRLRRLLNVGEEGRRFGAFDVVEEDLTVVRRETAALEVPHRPQEILDRAKACRNLTAIDFKSADADEYRGARRCWLVSAFWNSCLAEVWPTNDEKFVYDVLGYLTTIQGENRYATHVEGVLLLLRVSHLVCRIASSEDLVSTGFYEKTSGIEGWVRYTVGTVLAISGPGKVLPSRVGNDPRLVDGERRERSREEFGEILLPTWRTPEQREAACAVLLELAGWRLPGALRLVRSALRVQPEYEIWEAALVEVMIRAARVKVLRPNPWAEAAKGRTITADTHALAVLASDVIHRTFPSLESNISLNGTAFRQRRVPTFLCSADFGPLGMFKADARERISREAENFTAFAQRLHPRYRASRCDKSVAAISEPDDRIEFVGGLLTSYVFTALEAPRSLNSWFQSTDASRVLALVAELFDVALKPWYQHATLGILDILSEYELFSRAGLARLRAGLAARADLGVGDMSSLAWLDAIVGWVTGEVDSVDSAIEDHAARLQLCETLRAVTHGDLHLDNVMVLGRKDFEYPCLIDFETTSMAHLLRDFGRFAGAVFFRTTDWGVEDSVHIRNSIARGIESGYRHFSPREGAVAGEAAKALDVVEAAWQSYLQNWRGGCCPEQLEVVATVVCSFLPFARYPDTKQSAATLALLLAGDHVRSVWQGRDAQCASLGESPLPKE